MRFASPLLLTLALLIPSSLRADDAPLPSDPQQAIAEVAAGRLKTARADWWGFQPDDSTQALQSAIDSGAPRVVVPYVARPWIVRPITLRSNLELIFEPGAIVLAKPGEFRGGGDSLFTANDLENITITAYGALWRMRKRLPESPLR